LVYRKDQKHVAGNPVLLTAYGAYEEVIETDFDIDRISLHDRGIIYAIAHVRAGGDLGRKWYDSGKQLNEKQTFSDFIACAEHLLSQNIARTGRQLTRGDSSGGLVVGVAVNE